jgi:hypothetical protein
MISAGALLIGTRCEIGIAKSVSTGDSCLIYSAEKLFSMVTRTKVSKPICS